ncbi:Hypp7020 [Branchiostoma lanceolatum]|uniref:Hypp7020 protein n=1 Tax=Branchiostoma lanceolatum TaxID=7740 RepID=A0A8K0EBR6_BRALA|nr:Hypp7020 [Branchiostoma lanceolatum]
MSAAPPMSGDGQGGLVELSNGHSMSLQTARMMNVSLQRRLHDKVHRIELQHQRTRLARNIETRDLKDLLLAIKSQPLEYLEPENNPRAKHGKSANGPQRVSGNEPVRSASVSNMYIKTPSPGGASQTVPTLSFIQLASQMKAFSLPNLRKKPVNNNDKPSQIAMATKLTRKQRCASYSIGMEGEGPTSPAPLRLPSLANDTKWSLSLRK